MSLDQLSGGLIKTRNTLFILFLCWVVLVIVGVTKLWLYASTEGQAAHALLVWPENSHIQRDLNADATLVLFTHFGCSCSNATFEELNKIIAQSSKKLDIHIRVVTYENLDAKLQEKKIREISQTVPNAKVMSDLNGVEAKYFDAKTSGQTFLYDRNSKLLFSGGITPFRGHEGDNEGQKAIVGLINEGHTERNLYSVFGCSLFEESFE